MSKGLRNYPEHERQAVVLRRLAAKTNGCGYWAAVDAIRKMKIGRGMSPEALAALTRAATTE